MSPDLKLATYVDWPSAPLTQKLVHRALDKQPFTTSNVDSTSEISGGTDFRLQWSSYDSIDHELTLANPNTVLSSSYTIRKAIIRKHFLHRCLCAYTTKNPTSILCKSVPKTWDIDISYADELDELWSDELWELSSDLDNLSADKKEKWWILKPSMADRGMGIRLFNSKQALYDIFEAFDVDDGSDDSETEQNSMQDNARDTNVITSQLRHFVIQVRLLEAFPETIRV